MTTRKFLIVGATGKQGGAVVDALLATSSTSATPFEILAVTRNPESSKAKSLASHTNVTVIQGDVTDPEAIFTKAGSVDGVFSVTTPGKEGAEEEQAHGLIDASIAHGVKHFVYTSVDRGGPGVTERSPTNIPHFASKHRIEEYLKEKAAKSDMGWTLLRPVAFMDNLTPDFMGKGFASMWAQVGDKPLQLVSTKDIGHFGAVALLEPDKYRGQAIGIAGDELSFDEACKVFKTTTGKEMPQTFWFVGTGLKWAMKELGIMFEWFKTDGYGIDIQALRKQYPESQDFKKWLKESSGFREH